MSFFKNKKAVRAWIYGIIVAAGPLVSFYGLASEEEVALWLGLGATVLGVPGGGLALANLTPDIDPSDFEDVEDEEDPDED